MGMRERRWTTLHCPPPQSLRINSLLGQGMVGWPRVQDKRRLNDSTLGPFSRCGFAASRLVCATRETPSRTATKLPLTVVQLFSIASTPRCSLFLYHPPSILMYSYSLELAKRHFNVLPSHDPLCTSHPFSLSILRSVFFCLFGFLKVHATHAQYLACFYIYIQAQKNMVFLSL